MKKILGLLLGLTLLTSCAESLALLGPSSTAVTGGNIAQSAFSSAVNYGVKKQTGKSPMEHAIAYAEEMNPQKKKEPCLSFVEKTNSEICAIVKKRLKITKSKILNKSNEKSIKDLTSSLQPSINKKSKIKYLD
jgi:hypothetical protein|tara:strand:- start:325 stop:726 length:402 start_codon:yes stop_codon:yes gene_type:complete